jgi:hypothetical protein
VARHRVLVALCLSLAACSGAAPGPVDTVAAYAQALREGRYGDAYPLLSATARQGLPYEAFERLARERPDETRALADDYASVDPRAPLTARFALANGESVTLFYEDGAWRIDPAALVFYGQETPREALRSFARAVARQRWDVLLRLAPRAVAAQLRMANRSLRDAWTGPGAERDLAVLQRLVEALERGATPDVTGDRATLVYGEARAYVARLVREDGLWKVEDTD